MAKYTHNTGKPITPSVIQQVRRLARENTPTRVIGLNPDFRFGRGTLPRRTGVAP
jgi:hypothetical protein